MRIAVVTPVYRTPAAWLAQCLESVAQQTVSCTHFVVSDGDDSVDVARFPGVRLFRLPQAHHDCGNAARAIGSVSAIANDFDALAYLDADNWYEADHLERMVELQFRHGASVCTCARNLVDLEGRLLGRCPEVDGETFVDTSCLFLARPAFGIVASWYGVPRKCAAAGDRLVWKAIKEQRLRCSHRAISTLNYRTNYHSHYEFFGKTPPRGAKHVHIEITKDGQFLSVSTSALPAQATSNKSRSSDSYPNSIDRQ